MQSGSSSSCARIACTPCTSTSRRQTRPAAATHPPGRCDPPTRPQRPIHRGRIGQQHDWSVRHPENRHRRRPQTVPSSSGPDRDNFRSGPDVSVTLRHAPADIATSLEPPNHNNNPELLLTQQGIPAENIFTKELENSFSTEKQKIIPLINGVGILNNNYSLDRAAPHNKMHKKYIQHIHTIHTNKNAA